ncbi:hypothetical protein BGX26_001577 [Mortierella sp. AD094]|nr:hypothetical protein BGX26_001577 [Mortierella sp. AD094]
MRLPAKGIDDSIQPSSTYSLYTDRGSFLESTSLQGHEISESAIPIVLKVTQKKKSSTIKSSSKSTSSSVMKPIQFINETVPNKSRPKPRLGSYVPTHSAIQQKPRREGRDGGKIKRSDNCFIIYRTHMHPYIVAEHGNLDNQVISKIAGVLWKSTPECVKDIYRQKAYAASLSRKETLTRTVNSEGKDASDISSNEATIVSDIQPLLNSDDAAHPTGPAAASSQNSENECKPVSNGRGEKSPNGTRASKSMSKTPIRKSTKSRSLVVCETALLNDTGNSDIVNCNMAPSLSSGKAVTPPFRCLVPEDYSTMPSIELPKVFAFVLQGPSTTVPHHNYVQSPMISHMTIGPFAGMAPPDHSSPISPPLPSSPESADFDVTPMEGSSIVLASGDWRGEAEAFSKIASLNPTPQIFPHSPVNIEQPLPTVSAYNGVLKPYTAAAFAPHRSSADFVVQNTSLESSPAQGALSLPLQQQQESPQKPQSQRKYLSSDHQQEQQQIQLRQQIQSDSFTSALPRSDSFDQRSPLFTDLSTGSEPFLALSSTYPNFAELAIAGKKPSQPLPTTPMTPTLLSMAPNSSATTTQTMQTLKINIEYPYTATEAPLAMTVHEYEWSTSGRPQQMPTPMEWVSNGSKPSHQQVSVIATPLTQSMAPIMPSKNGREYFDLVPVYGQAAFEWASPASALPSFRTLNGLGNSNLAIGTPHRYPAMVAPAVNVPHVSPSYSYQLQQQQLQQLYSVLENDDEERSCERLRLSIEYYEKLLELQTWQLQQAQRQQQLFA